MPWGSAGKLLLQGCVWPVWGLGGQERSGREVEQVGKGGGNGLALVLIQGTWTCISDFASADLGSPVGLVGAYPLAPW